MTIWKFPLPIDDEPSIEAPRSARIIHVGLDPKGMPCVWAEVDQEAPYTSPIWLRLVGTGHEMGDSCGQYIGSFVHGEFMWHVYFAR